MSGDGDARHARRRSARAGEPASWRRAAEGERRGARAARVGRRAAGRSSTGPTRATATSSPSTGEVAAANRRMRDGAMPDDLRGPFIKPPVWTWEMPLYFWVGGVASGSAFVALAADLAGDEWSAAVARKVALAAVLPAPVLLIADLGRPARFLNMLRIFKPRSPMNLGAWCLVAFSAVGAGAVGADLLGLPPHGARAGRGQRAARRLPRLLHRRAAGGHRRAGVGAQPRLPRADLRLDRDGHRRRRHAAGAGGRGPAPRTIRPASRSAAWRPPRSSPS